MGAFSFFNRFVVAAGAVVAGTLSLSAQGNYATEGGEYNVAGVLPGEQVYPAVSIKTTGGYMVWQDKVTDGSGAGISARKLDGSLSATLSPFRVNVIGAEEQERPGVAMLNDGGAVFIWEGGKQSYQHIYARFLSPAGLWVTGDVKVSSPTNLYQMESAVTVLTNGNVVVVWSSFNQVATGSMRDVYSQILTPAGVKVGGEILVNQAAAYNQRTAAVAALSDGRYVVVWISEQQRGQNIVDVYGRIFTAAGTPATSEFLINTGTNVCANPSVAASADGGFMVTWAEKDVQVLSNSWDIFARPVSAMAIGGITRRINTTTFGDQYAPKISAMGTDYLVVWTSLGQDGSREGVYGQFLRGDGTLLYGEQRVNSTTVSQQMHPAVASDGVARFAVVWSSFVGGDGSFDLHAQRYVNTSAPLPAPSAPWVSVLSASSLGLTWPPVSGFSVAHYEVYADGAATPSATVTNIHWNLTGLATGSTHTFRLAYFLTDGRRSPLSEVATGTTYQYPFNSGGIPYDWMIQMFGENTELWPLASVDTDGDGASNLQEFLQGTDPKNAASVLRYTLRSTGQGLFLDWNTQPGLVYQVQFKANPAAAWANLGGSRFAGGTNDSLYVGGNDAGFFRIGRVR